MQTERFPREIFDLIIDESSDSYEDLKIFALVAKSWLPRSREHLFRLLHIWKKLTVHDESHEGLNQRIAAMEESFRHFISTPELVRCVKGGHITFTGTHPIGSRFSHLPQAPDATQYQEIILNPCQIPNENLVNLQFFIFDHGDLHDLTTALFRNRCAVKRLFLLETTLSPHSSNLFQNLISQSTSLETVCLQDVVLDFPHHQQLDPGYLCILRESIAEGKVVAPKQVYVRYTNPSALCPPNSLMEALLFGTSYLAWTRVIHLALDSAHIPTFVGQADCLSNVQHLTLFDGPGDGLLDVWAFSKAYLQLLSLVDLQIVLQNSYASLITLCRVILGPCTAEIPPSVCGHIEYPGHGSYALLRGNLPQQDSARTYPRVNSLHIDIDFSRMKSRQPALDASLASKLDAVLSSYLDTSHGEPAVKQITVNRPDSFLREFWSATTNTGRIKQGQGFFWWDYRWW